MSDPRVEAIRRAIMASMAFTEKKHPGYTHDDYDQAHAALEALNADLRNLRDLLGKKEEVIEVLRSQLKTLR